MTDRAAVHEALRAMYHPPAWVEGGISGEDAAFLLELVLDHGPRRVLEVGTAAGTSSAALLFALDQLQDPEGATLVSVDIRATCYFDVHRRTGSAVADLYPQPRARWQLDAACDARLACTRYSAGPIDLALVDANHRHPWPLVDLLYLASILRPAAWVALHDIDLPRLYPAYAAEGSGAQYLFEAWPFEKVRAPGAVSNIGAVRLPADLAELVPMALALLHQPWEAQVMTLKDFPPVFAAIAHEAPRACRPAIRRRPPAAPHR